MTDFNTKNPFKIPENYFKELEENLIKNKQPTQKEHGFNVPKYYFNTLEETILRKSKKTSPFSRRKLIVSFTTLAAALALLFTIPSSQNSETQIEEQAFNDYLESYYLEDMNGYEILSMLEDNEIDPYFDNSTKNYK
jgi:hypothetical protein